MEDQLKHAALEYHRLPTPGKIAVVPTKGLFNQRDLALAYSPGVAYACKAIEADPDYIDAHMKFVQTVFDKIVDRDDGNFQRTEALALGLGERQPKDFAASVNTPEVARPRGRARPAC